MSLTHYMDLQDVSCHVQPIRAHEMEQPQPIEGLVHCSSAVTVRVNSNRVVMFTAALGLDLLFRDNIRLGWFLSSRDWFLRSHPIHVRIGLYLLFLPWWCGRQGIGMVAPLGFRQSKACMNSAAPAHGTLMGCT